VFLGVAAYAEAEIGMAGLQQRDEVAGVAETVLAGREGGLALGRIAAQRHDIAETTGINAIGDLGKFGAGVTHTREVRHDGEAKVAFQKVTDLCRAVASRAPGSGGQGYEIGAMRFSAVAVARTASTPGSSLGEKKSSDRSGRFCAKSSEMGRSCDLTFHG